MTKSCENKVMFLDYSPHYAGAERAMASLIIGLKERGYIPYIAVPYPMPHHERYQELGVGVIYLNRSIKWWMGRSRWHKPVRGADLLSRIIWGIQLACVMVKNGFGLLHVNLLRPDSFMWLFFAKIAGVKIVAHFRSLPDAWIPGSCVQKCCHHVICVSKIVQANLNKFFTNERSSVIYDPVCMPACMLSREEAKKQLHLSSDRTVIASVAALFPNKGHDQAIHSFSRIADRFPDADLYVVGGGNAGEVERLKSIVQGYPDLHNRVFFTEKQVSNVEVVYKAASLVLSLTKEGEAFGLVPLEAALMDTPCIAPIRGAIIEFTEHNYNSFLVDTLNTEAVSEMITYVLSNPVMASDVCGRMRRMVGNDFSISKHTQNVIAVYNSL